MPKRLTILLEDDLYHQLLTRAGGPRKISAYLNSVLRGRLDSPSLDGARPNVRDLHGEVARLARELAAVQQRLPPIEPG